MPVASARLAAGESRTAKSDAGDGESRKDQRLMLPGERRIAPGNRCDAERRGGKPDTDHRRHGDFDHREGGPKNSPIPIRHQRPSVGLPAGLAARGGAAKLSRATSAIPASDPIIDALSSGIMITFWFGAPARRPRASI